MALLKRNDQVTGGDLNRPLWFYQPADTEGTDGGVVRDPVFAYKLMGDVQPGRDQEADSLGKMTYFRKALITLRYVPSRIPIEGMTVLDVRSGDTYEVRGAIHVNSSNRKVELTGLLVR